MSLNFKAGAVAAATALRRMGSLAFWLQLGACAVVAWSLFHAATCRSPGVAGTVDRPASYCLLRHCLPGRTHFGRCRV
jgi:hypothetical protein